jgi:hypothetical protein
MVILALLGAIMVGCIVGYGVMTLSYNLMLKNKNGKGTKNDDN